MSIERETSGRGLRLKGREVVCVESTELVEAVEVDIVQI